jgi:hypothetical protein
MFGDAEHYKYLTNEADLNNAVDDSMALTPKTPKREDTKISAASPQTPVDYSQSQIRLQEINNQLQEQTVKQQQQQQYLHPQFASQSHLQQPSDNAKIGSVGNMSMPDSVDASYYNSAKNVNGLESDNIPVEARPKAAG